MFTVKAYSEVKPGDVLKVAGQAIRVLEIDSTERGGFLVEGQDDKRKPFPYMVPNDRFVKCFGWTEKDWDAFCDDDLAAFNN
jgi:neutral trehalase